MEKKKFLTVLSAVLLAGFCALYVLNNKTGTDRTVPNNTQKEIKGDAAFVTKLETGKRNNITVKGYSNGQLVAVASTDILDQN